MSKETYVKPYKRKNKKRRGKHQVKGHTRHIGNSKRSDNPVRDIQSEDLSNNSDIVRWNGYVIRKEEGKDIKNKDKAEILISPSTVDTIPDMNNFAPEHIKDVRKETIVENKDLRETFKSLRELKRKNLEEEGKKEINRNVYNYDGMDFIIYDWTIYRVRPKGENRYVLEDVILSYPKEYYDLDNYSEVHADLELAKELINGGYV